MSSRSRRWLVVGVPPQRRFGWEIRASRIFEGLSRRRPTFVLHRPTPLLALQFGATHRSFLWSGTAVAATDLLPSAAMLAIARRIMSLEVLDVHDHPVLQRDALGLELASGQRNRLNTLFQRNVDSFSSLVVPSSTFADLARVPMAQRIVIPNGTDTAAIAQGPWPSSPVIAMVSGAAPGRGIELLIEAVRLVRLEYPDATLRLALVATDAASGAYMEAVSRRARAIDWLSVQSVPYTEIGTFLAAAMVIAVPHPGGAYMDAAMPVKVFDAMAAARPLLVTPRVETARVVRDADAGAVAESDAPEDVAHALTGLLGDEDMARRLGANGRVAAETKFDWSVLATELADALLGPERGA